MKSVVVFALAFVAATAASTGAKVFMTKPGSAPALAAHDSTKSDSTKKPDSAVRVDTAVQQSGAPAPAPADTLRVPPAPIADTTKAKQSAPAAVTPAAVTPAATPT